MKHTTILLSRLSRIVVYFNNTAATKLIKSVSRIYHVVYRQRNKLRYIMIDSPPVAFVAVFANTSSMRFYMLFHQMSPYEFD